MRILKDHIIFNLKLTPNIALKSGSRNRNGIFETCNLFGTLARLGVFDVDVVVLDVAVDDLLSVLFILLVFVGVDSDLGEDGEMDEVSTWFGKVTILPIPPPLPPLPPPGLDNVDKFNELDCEDESFVFGELVQDEAEGVNIILVGSIDWFCSFCSLLFESDDIFKESTTKSPLLLAAFVSLVLLILSLKSLGVLADSCWYVEHDEFAEVEEDDGSSCSCCWLITVNSCMCSWKL